MDEQPVIDRIERLVEEEHRLWRSSEQGGLTDPEPPHLEHGVHDDQPAPDPEINPNVP